jgi:hypothetical protein
MLKINDMRDRARLRFGTREMDIEDEEAKGDDARLGVATALAGAWGEDMAAFLLESEYKAHDLRAGVIGRGYWPYDLFIDHPVDNTLFSGQAAISVKAVSAETSCTKPSFEELSEIRSSLEERGIHLWLAVLQYYYHGSALGFGMYIIDPEALDRDDFDEVPGSQHRPDLLNVVRARRKAAVRLWSGEMKLGLEDEDVG